MDNDDEDYGYYPRLTMEVICAEDGPKGPLGFDLSPKKKPRKKQLTPRSPRSRARQR